jgi:hypothetical protein
MILKMRTIATIFCAVLFVGCGNIEVRVKNEFRHALPNFAIGTVDFDTVASGVATGYKQVDEGTHSIFMNSRETGKITINTAAFSGSSRWTLTVSDDDTGTYVLSED